jgi:hypothetical protein
MRVPDRRSDHERTRRTDRVLRREFRIAEDIELIASRTSLAPAPRGT